MAMYYLIKLQSDFDGVLLVDESRCEGIFTELLDWKTGFSNKDQRYHIEYISIEGESVYKQRYYLFPALDLSLNTLRDV